MNIGNQLGVVARAIGAHPKALKLGLLGTGLAGSAALLTGCSTKDSKPDPATDAATVASNMYHDFDANHDGSISPDESSIPQARTWNQDTVNVRFPIGNGQFTEIGSTKTYRQNYDRSIDKVRAAAGGADAIASWQEIGKFALDNFDQPGRFGLKDHKLDATEQANFAQAYGEQDIDRGGPDVIAQTPFVRTTNVPNNNPAPGYPDVP